MVHAQQVHVGMAEPQETNLQHCQECEASLCNGTAGPTCVQDLQHRLECRDSHVRLHHCVVLAERHQALQGGMTCQV